MTPTRLLLGLCWVLVIYTQHTLASRIVNISDAWLLSDAESPVFYRHFRDRVTWSEAEAICQFHHSVLATVRNTGEFDRTRALLQELDWITPVWVGLRRVLGQPMFKWSTPAGATLLPSDGYWYEAPNTLTSRALCVMVDPAADFRWRAVDCGSSTDLFSFLCQIPVPTWARSEHGGCLSPRWPSAEVTVQFLPQTRALEMTANCGLRGTKRIACKQHSTVDIQHMERKLQCPSDVTSVSGSATPPRPPTRHRRDTKPSTAPTPDSANLTRSAATAEIALTTPQSSGGSSATTRGQAVATESATVSVTPHSETATPLNAPATPPVTAGAPEAAVTKEETTSANPATTDTVKVLEVTQQTEQAISKVMESIKFIPMNEIKSTVSTSTKLDDHLETSTDIIQQLSTKYVESIVETDDHEISPSTATQNIIISEDQSSSVMTETSTQEEITPESITSTYEPSSTSDNIVTTHRHPAYLYSKGTTASELPSHDNIVTVTHAPHMTVESQNNLQPIQNMQPMTHHVSAGTPRNIPTLTHVNSHPPMVIAVAHLGTPRNVPGGHTHVVSMQHPVVLTEGNPRIAASADIHRSAEDHVTSRRRQFLPAPLRGLPPTPGAPRSQHHPVMSEVTEEAEDEEEQKQTTVDPLNSQTEEEMMEAEQRRLNSRRTHRPQETSKTRNLYPYLLNRMLG